ADRWRRAGRRAVDSCWIAGTSREESPAAAESGGETFIIRESSMCGVGHQEHFGGAAGVDVVVNLVGSVGLADDHVHELMCFLRGTQDEASFERDVGKHFIAAFGGAATFECAELVVFRSRIFG